MKCPNCDKNISIQNGGIRVLTYTFCSSNCFTKYFTLAQLKKLNTIISCKN